MLSVLNSPKQISYAFIHSSTSTHGSTFEQWSILVPLTFGPLWFYFWKCGLLSNCSQILKWNSTTYVQSHCSDVLQAALPQNWWGLSRFHLKRQKKIGFLSYSYKYFAWNVKHSWFFFFFAFRNSQGWLLHGRKEQGFKKNREVLLPWLLSPFTQAHTSTWHFLHLPTYHHTALLIITGIMATFCLCVCLCPLTLFLAGLS